MHAATSMKNNNDVIDIIIHFYFSVPLCGDFLLRACVHTIMLM